MKDSTENTNDIWEWNVRIPHRSKFRETTARKLEAIVG